MEEDACATISITWHRIDVHSPSLFSAFAKDFAVSEWGKSSRLSKIGSHRVCRTTVKSPAILTYKAMSLGDLSLQYSASAAAKSSKGEMYVSQHDWRARADPAIGEAGEATLEFGVLLGEGDAVATAFSSRAAAAAEFSSVGTASF